MLRFPKPSALAMLSVAMLALLVTVTPVAAQEPNSPATVAAQHVEDCESILAYVEAAVVNYKSISATQNRRVAAIHEALGRAVPAGADPEIIKQYRAYLEAALQAHKNRVTENGWIGITVFGGICGAVDFGATGATVGFYMGAKAGSAWKSMTDARERVHGIEKAQGLRLIRVVYQ